MLCTYGELILTIHALSNFQANILGLQWSLFEFLTNPCFLNSITSHMFDKTNALDINEGFFSKSSNKVSYKTVVKGVL